MADQPAKFSTLDSATLAQLACPACYGGLHLESASLICSTCRRAYPIVNGIPVLIMDRAERQGEEF